MDKGAGCTLPPWAGLSWLWEDSVDTTGEGLCASRRRLTNTGLWPGGTQVRGMVTPASLPTQHGRPGALGHGKGRPCRQRATGTGLEARRSKGSVPGGGQWRGCRGWAWGEAGRHPARPGPGERVRMRDPVLSLQPAADLPRPTGPSAGLQGTAGSGQGSGQGLLGSGSPPRGGPHRKKCRGSASEGGEGLAGLPVPVGPCTPMAAAPR